MRALTVVPGRAGSLAVTEVPEPEPGSGEDELLVDGLAVGVCGTDREIDRNTLGPGRGWLAPTVSRRPHILIKLGPAAVITTTVEVASDGDASDNDRTVAHRQARRSGEVSTLFQAHNALNRITSPSNTLFRASGGWRARHTHIGRSP